MYKHATGYPYIGWPICQIRKWMCCRILAINSNVYMLY